MTPAGPGSGAGERRTAAVVTGGGRGIGEAIATKLAAEWAVAVLDVDMARAAAVAAAIDASGGTALALGCDVADYDAVGRCIAAVEADLGPIDVLVNNAGITRDRIAHKMDREDWDAVIAVNLGGAFNTVRHAVPPMRSRRSGRIVNIASRAILGNVGQANYAASKAGLIGLTRTLALELGGHGITVNAVCPGFTETPMTDALPEEIRRRVISQIPLGRAGRPEDVANAVYFFCSDLGSYVTGATLHVGGGRELASTF